LLSENIDTIPETEIKVLVNSMNDSANNLYKLLKNLLEWAQMHQNSFDFSPEELNLKELTEVAVISLKQSASQKEIEVTNAIPEFIKVNADKNMLNSVLRNLLSNAIKYTNRGGIVNINANELPNRMIEISVKDNGVGISDVDIKRLFKIEEKVRSKGTEGEDTTGLGLLLCKEFIEKNGGKIWVESMKGKGSTFSFSLPQC
jgi:signal transduction histidine kinase